MAGVKIKANINVASLKTALRRQNRLVTLNIATVIKKEALPFLIERIMVGFDDLSDRADLLAEDPTNPSNWRAEFLLKLEEDLERTFVITENRISVSIGEKDFLGYDPSGRLASDDTEPLHWLVFYLEGLVGDWGFISPETYTRITKQPYKTTWGRFSDGFMISRQDYEDQGWDRVMGFDQVRHPFSGFSPLDIFAEALREFRLKHFIQRALDAAIRGKKL